MPRRPRKQRRARSAARRPLRRNNNYGVVLTDLAELSKAGSGNELVVFPVNPLSLTWAATAYDLQQQFVEYQQETVALIQQLGQVDPTLPSELMAGGTLDEMALLTAVGDVIDQAKSSDAPPAVVEAAEAGREVLTRIGLAEELAALAPFPNYGLLAGQGILDAGLEATGDKAHTGVSRIKDHVVSLRQKLAAARAGYGYPIEEVARASAGRISAVLLPLGQPDDLEGMSLMPVAPSREMAQRTAAGLVRAVLARGLWSPPASDSRVGWAAGSQIRWALPEPFLNAKGMDATRSSELASFLCSRNIHYGSGEYKLSLGFSANKRSFAGTWNDGSSVQPVRGAFDPGMNAYRVQLPQGQVTLTLGKDGAAFDVPGVPPLPVISAGRQCPGPGVQHLMPPGVIAWLRDGVDLMAREEEAENTAKLLAYVTKRSDLSRGESRRILNKLREDMGQVPISYVGTIQGAQDGVPRYLPAEGPVSWYGSPSAVRAVVAQRLGKRVQLSGSTKPPPLLFLQYLAEIGKRPFSDNEEVFRMLRKELTVATVQGLEGRDLKKFERSVFEAGEKRERKIAASLPLDGASTPLCSAVFTLYGMSPDGNYTVLWQSTPLSVGQIDQAIDTIYRVEGEVGPEGQAFVPRLALRRWIAEQSGLLELLEQQAQTKKKDRIPYEIVMTMLVDRRRLALLREPRLPKPLDLGEGQCMGRRVPMGMMLGTLDVSNIRGEPAEAILAVHEDGVPPGIVPARPTMGDYWRLSESLVQVGVTRTRALLPLWNTPWSPGDLFSYANIQQTSEFRSLKAALTEKGEGVPPSDDLVYRKVLAFNIPTTYGGSTTPDVVIGGRRAFQAFGGEQARVKRVGQRRAAKGWTPGRLVSPDPKQSVWATRRASMRRDIFGFAASVCKQIGCLPHGVRRTEIDPTKKVWREGLQDLKTEDNIVIQKLADYGILDEIDLADPQSVRDGLVKLRNALRPDITLKTQVGQIPTQLEIAVAEIDSLPDDSPLLDAYLAEDVYEINDFAQEQLDRMAKQNGRRRRRPRRSRRSQKNPLTPFELEEATGYATSRKKQPDPGELDATFRRLRESSDPLGWELSGERVDQMFPRKYAGRGTWSPANRFKALERFDMVSRVGEVDPTSEMARAGRAAVFESAMPTDNEAVRALALAEAGMSLDEATRILQAQGGKRSSGYTMAPSSAICKLYRSRRLTAYRPPEQAFKAIETQGGKPVLLWMSPDTANQPRVMSFRRGSHVDCDMVGRQPEDLPELLGKAIQSALFWSVEKPRRSAVTDVWVGRAGQPDLYLALRRGEVVSLGQVSANLRKASEGVEGYRLPFFNTPRQLEAGTRNDVKAYMDAARRQIGPEAAQEIAAARPAGARSAGAAQPAAPAPVAMPVADEEEFVF